MGGTGVGACWYQWELEASKLRKTLAKAEVPSSYPPTPCPVLIEAMWPRVRYAKCGTGIGHAYAECGTEIGYGAMGCGTEIGYGTTGSGALSSPM
eukprot:1598898-Rhodomonas_salina.1